MKWQWKSTYRWTLGKIGQDMLAENHTRVSERSSQIGERISMGGVWNFLAAVGSWCPLSGGPCALRLGSRVSTLTCSRNEGRDGKEAEHRRCVSAHDAAVYGWLARDAA